MLLYRCVCFKLKHHSYSIIGLIIGILISFNYFHYEDVDLCQNYNNIHNNAEEQINAPTTTDGYEPKFLQNKPMQTKKLAKNLQRPRYYSTELGIREKLFVAVVTSEKSINHAIAVNKTLAHVPNKIKFFITANAIKSHLNLTNIVVFTDTREILKPFHLVKYLCDNYLNDFDYYYLISDVGYVDGRKLMDLVNGISVSEDVYLGTTPEPDSNYCSLDAGMLISSSVLRKIRDNLDWCVRNTYSGENYENIGRCIIHSANIKCQKSVQGQEMTSYRLSPEWNLQTDLKTVIQSNDFNEAVSVYPIKNYSDIYNLQLYFARLHLEAVNKEIASLSKFVSTDSFEGHWPAGLRNDPTLPLPRPPDRFHQPRYSTINTTHNLMPDDYTNVLEHSDAEKQDIDNIINNVISKVESGDSNLKYHSLVNGYRRFDPSRGTNYIFDMNFKSLDNDDDVTLKRMEVFKPLGKATVLTVPYVTENTRIIMILPIWQHEVLSAADFVKHFETTFLEKKDKLSMLMVFMYPAEAPSKGPEDQFGTLKSCALDLSEKYRLDGLKVVWLSIRLPAVSFIFDETGLVTMAALDLALRKMPLDSLVLLGKSQMLMKPDYLNRIRMNTVSGYQIFSPIGFQLYHPQLSTGLIPSKGSGRFASWDYRVLSFYSRDYVNVRKLIQDKYPIVRADKDIENLFTKTNTNMTSIFEMFVKYSPNLHAFRAVEPGVLFKYDESIYCPPEEAYKNQSLVDFEAKDHTIRFGNTALTEKCLDKLSKDNFESIAIGGRSQLAKMIFET